MTDTETIDQSTSETKLLRLACEGRIYPIKDWTWKLEDKGQDVWVDPVAMARLVLTDHAFDEWLEHSTEEQRRPRWHRTKGPVEVSLILWLAPLTDDQTRALSDAVMRNLEMRFFGEWWPKETPLWACRFDVDPQGPRFDIAQPGLRIALAGGMPSMPHGTTGPHVSVG
jgi:hypothetical protein